MREFLQGKQSLKNMTDKFLMKKKRHFVKPSVQEQPKMSMQHVFHSFIFYNCALVCLL